MPLHLLGKKSWNVYNADNIARVQRDEAAAAAEEHAAEQRMQDADAARRLAVLRGETPPPLPEADEQQQPADPADKRHVRRDHRDGGASRKRKRAGEDDTDFEMRVARERAEEGAMVARELGGADASRGQKQNERGDVDIVDSRGFIDLVGPPPKDAGGYDAHAAERPGRERRETVDRKENGAFGDLAGQPWYKDEKRRQTPVKSCAVDACKTAVAVSLQDREAERGMEAPSKDVWGRDDPKRRGRETARLDANDPLAAMKSGAKQVRDIGKERRREAEERSRELEQLRKEERRREKRRKREQARADDGRDGDESDEGRVAGSHRSGRSERRHHGDERHEGRRDHGHRDERRRRGEAERPRHREDERRDGRERERSRERGASSRSHRDRDRDDRRGHHGKDHERRISEAQRR